MESKLINCKVCNVELTGKKINFCSPKCRVKQHHLLNGRKLNSNCELCNKPIQCRKESIGKNCRKCNDILKRREINNTQVKDFIYKNRGQTNKYTRFRELSRRVAFETLNRNNITHQCCICGYSNFVEVCHIKPVCQFSEETLVSVVNHINNLTILCPNHHVEIDRKIRSITDIKSIEQMIICTQDGRSNH